MMKISSVILCVKTLTVATAFIYSSHLIAQSSHIGTLPMQFNPAFAGAAGSSRIGSSSDLRKSEFFGSYVRKNFAFSYDNFIPKVGSGIGIQGSYTRTAVNNLNRNRDGKADHISLGLSIAPKFSFKGRYTLSPAVEINAKLKNVDYEDISQRSERITTSFRPGVRLGLAFNTSNFYVGLSHHIEGIYNGHSRSLDFDRDISLFSSPRSYLQMGYNFRKREDSKFSFSPQIVFGRYTVRSNYENRDYVSVYSYTLLNLMFKYKQVVLGPIWDSYGGIKLMAGWQKKNFRIAYVQGGLFNGSFNGQISLRYILNTGKASNLSKNVNY